MDKVNVNAEDATVVEETAHKKDGDMREPMNEPNTANYDQMLRITEPFINDLKQTLGDMAYSTAKQFINFVEVKKERISLSEVTELVNKLRTLPYRIVAPLMKNIENPEIINKYFVSLPNEGK